MGLTQHVNAVANIQEVVNLLLLRGNIGKRGAGICPVRGHSNVQGQRTVGIAEKPELVPLDKLGADYDVNDLLPKIRDAVSVDGKLYAAPFYGESSMLMYRKDLADKAGARAPTRWGGQQRREIEARLLVGLGLDRLVQGRVVEQSDVDDGAGEIGAGEVAVLEHDDRRLQRPREVGGQRHELQ